MTAHLSDNAYGKSRVRVTKVQREPAGRHELFEFDIDIQLRGAFDPCYLSGDNTGVLPTDTMKNTVYAMAAQHRIESAEQFALLLSGHFSVHPQLPHLSDVRIDLRQARWKRVRDQNGNEHPWSFVNGGTERRTCRVERGRSGSSAAVWGGIEDLLLLKTSDSAFVNFVRDAYTTLPDASDRIFATTVRATWKYAPGDQDWNGANAAIRAALIDTFAGHKSLAVQQTLFAMGEAALAACAGIEEIEIWMPNQHRIPLDLRPLGLENRNEVFITTSEPFGLIGGTIRRT
jgi:urate oxidase